MLRYGKTVALAVIASLMLAFAGAGVAKNIRTPKPLPAEPPLFQYVHCAAAYAVSPCSWEFDPGLRQTDGEPPYPPAVEPARPATPFEQRFSPER